MPRKKERMPEQVEVIENPYLPTPAKVISLIRETPDCFLLKIDYKKGHEPGQFVQVYLPGIGEVPISICSYSQEFMELNIRQVGNVTNSLANLKKGDTVYVRGPYGKGYPMKELLGKNLILIGGGSGVAPLKGIISYVDANKDKFGLVQLYFGFRTPDDILFKQEMKQWKNKYQLQVSVDKNPKKQNIHCDVCFITDEVKDAKLSKENSAVFICGPPVMMNVAIQILKEKGFTEQQIYLSTERLMHCALGICGHCMIHGKYTCKDGPVFRYDELSQHKND